MKDITEIPESFQNGRYKVLKLLGEGGKGIVYKCIDNNLNRIVAIKLIKGDVLERDSYQRRISNNSNILPDLVRINFIHAGAMEQHGKPS